MAPVGDCYVAAFKAVTEMTAGAPRGKLAEQDVFLVHGSVMPRLGPAAGRRIDHAWVETGDQAIEVSNGKHVSIARDDYYEAAQARVRVRYNPMEAMIEFLRNKHFGPWGTQPGAEAHGRDRGKRKTVPDGTPGTFAEIRRFLATGEYDPVHAAWPGKSALDRIRRGERELLKALAAEVRHRAGTPETPAALRGLDPVQFTRQKVAPMVRGLFSRTEQATVLWLVERSVVFVTPGNIETILTGQSFLHSAWDIANLCLGGVRVEPLSDAALPLLGLSEDQTCYVSPAYFEEPDPFADFVVHEVAHIFHNTRCQTAGLPETQWRKCLLEIDYSKRETFAYACEAYSRILERSRGPAQRRELAQEFDGFEGVKEDRVDPAEVADIVRAASERRNGWREILARCAPCVARHG